jgi:benzoate-CoA ligase family protein
MTTPTFPDDFNLADYFLFDRIAEGKGDKVALRYGEREYSYADVAERSRALASYLVQLGVRPEERVYTVLPDAPPFAWSLFGTFASGAVVAMGNPHAPPKDLEYVIEYSRASVLVITDLAAMALCEFLSGPGGRHLRAVLLVPDTATGSDPEMAVAMPDFGDAGFVAVPLSEALKIGRKEEAALPQSKRDDLCMWLFTSGSTGRPKAAMHTHRDFAYNTEVYAKGTVGYQEDDISVSVPRLFFGYATGTNLFFPFAVGASVGLFAERPTPENLARAITMYKPTVITNVPTMMGKLLDHDDALRAKGKEGLDMSAVRFQLSAGEALPPALYERFVERFGGEVYDGIGSAEMFHIYASNRPGDVKGGALGKAVEGYELKVLPKDATGPGAEPVPDGEIGVLWVRGDSVALGYFQDRDRSWKTFHGHWCRTGDLFKKDAEGYLWFAGRDDDLFKVSGVWVSPLEVETCLMNHGAVSLAAVIKVEDEGLLKPKAFVVLRPESSERAGEELVGELQEHCKRVLSKHKYPRVIEFLAEMPKNDRGKIDKKSLAARA